MSGGGGRRRHAIEESGTWSTGYRRGSKWVVRTGHSHQSGYVGPPAPQPQESLARDGVHPRIGRPPVNDPPPGSTSWMPVGSPPMRPGWTTPGAARGAGAGTTSVLPVEGPRVMTRLSGLPPASSSDPALHTSEQEGGASKKREAPQRQSARIRAQSSTRDADLTEAATTTPVVSHQAHRLALEHTYIQGDENRLCGLLEDLRKVRAVEAFPKLQHPSLQVLEMAKDLNRIRFRHGDDHDRLTTSIQAVQWKSITDVRNPDWKSQGHMQYSPVTAMAAATQCRRQVVGAPPMQMWLSTTGVMVEIDRIVDVCARFRGTPCTITSPNVKPSGCEMLSDHFDRLNTCRVQLMRQISQAPESEVGEMEARMSALHNEHSSLLALVVCSNSRLIGPWRHQWQPPYSLGPQMPAIWESVKVTPEQKWQLFSMRERARDIIVTAKTAHSCSLDMATELTSTTPSASTDSVADNIALLDIVEASEQAKFVIPATEVMVAQAAFCNILSPLQSARLIISIRMLYMSIPGLHFEAVDFLRFAAACLLDQELGAWLDDTLPPSWWPDS